MKLKKYEQYRKGFPYFKVQWYDNQSKVWREIQRRFDTEAAARKYGQAVGGRHRVVKVTRDRRQII